MGPVRKQKKEKEIKRDIVCKRNTEEKVNKIADGLMNAIPRGIIDAVQSFLEEGKGDIRGQPYDEAQALKIVEDITKAIPGESMDVIQQMVKNWFQDVACYAQIKGNKMAQDILTALPGETIAKVTTIIEKGGDPRLVMDQLQHLTQEVARRFAKKCLKGPQRTSGQPNLLALRKPPMKGHPKRPKGK